MSFKSSSAVYVKGETISYYKVLTFNIRKSSNSDELSLIMQISFKVSFHLITIFVCLEYPNGQAAVLS